MRPDEVVLREARPEDALALSVLSTAVWIDTYATAGVRPTIAREVSQQFDAGCLRREIVAATGHWLIAAEGEHVLGYASWHAGTHADEPATRGGFELDTLYVLSRFAGDGIGARLLREALRRCTGSCLWTTAWVGNPRARRFYEREGFTVRRIVDYAFEGEHHDNWLLVHAPAGAE
jgi:GNAT superfamily N-acetyltransferase